MKDHEAMGAKSWGNVVQQLLGILAQNNVQSKDFVNLDRAIETHAQLRDLGARLELGVFERRCVALLVACSSDLEVRNQVASRVPSQVLPTVLDMLSWLSNDPIKDRVAFSPEAPLVFLGIVNVPSFPSHLGALSSVSGISIADRVVSFVFGHNPPLLCSTLVFDAGDVKKARLRLSERQRQDAKALRSILERVQTQEVRGSVNLVGNATGVRRMLCSAATDVALRGGAGLTIRELHVGQALQVLDASALLREVLLEVLLVGVLVLLRVDNIAPSNPIEERERPAALDAEAGFVRDLIGMSGVLGLPLLVSSRYALPALAGGLRWVAKPSTPEERLELWDFALSEVLGEQLGVSLRQDQVLFLAQHLNLDEDAMRGACARALEGTINAGVLGLDETEKQNGVFERVWNAALDDTRERLDKLNLVKRVEPKGEWGDLVFPQELQAQLASVQDFVRWRFAARALNPSVTERGQGVLVLLAGVSGGGKSTAVELMARALGYALYRVELQQTVSKFIGETEKLLEAVFDAAELGGVILLFDEADALFGKRSQTQSSNDRYANQEVAYLLQRIEHFSGVVFLTSNLEASIDSAFARRMKFTVRFEKLKPEEQVLVWRKKVALRFHDALDFDVLGKLELSGASIENIVLHAGVDALSRNEVFGMGHVLRAVRGEYQKMGRVLPQALRVGLGA